MRNDEKKPKKIRYAVVGLGYISQVAVLPAFAHAKNSELRAFVSDDPVKVRRLTKDYNVDLVYSYEEYERCLSSGEIDAVYIALPNHMHRDFAVRAAEHGIHVLCEKPMAVTEDECEDMIRACKANRVKLMVAYRLHFEEANLKAVEIAQSAEIGDPRIFESTFTQQVKDQDNIRLEGRSKGGGTLYDIGIYCINAARYLFRAEPVEVMALTANNGEKRFQDSEEMASAILRFPKDRLASFTCSFGAADTSAYRVVGTKGDLRVEPAYDYIKDLKHYLRVGEKISVKSFLRRDQFAPELIYFSDCILRNKQPEPSGLQGMADVRIIEALYESAATGEPVSLEPLAIRKHPSMALEIHRPKIGKAPLIRVTNPAQ